MAHLNIISKKDKFIGRKARYFSLRFVELSIQNTAVSKLVEPHMQQLLDDYIIPLVGMSVWDAIEFKDNPGESIRKELSSDPAMSNNCPKIAASCVLKELIKYKPEGNYEHPPLLEGCLKLIMDHLNAYKSNPDTDFRVKDATVYALYCIAPEISEYEPYLEHIENILHEHILCDFESDIEFLRARALLCYNKITEDIELEHVGFATAYLDSLCSKLNEDECLNVRVYALACIKKMLSQEIGVEYFRDKVGKLLEINLQVLDEFFIEDLIETLNEVVNVFNKEAVPYAAEVCSKLKDAYSEIMSQLGTSDNDLENSKMANTANGCITAIYRLVRSIGSQGDDNDKEVIMKIEEDCHDVLLFSLDLKYVDVHEPVMNCISAMSFYCESITPNLWQLFEKLVEIVAHHLNPETPDYGYISPGVTGILNFMQKDPDTFISTTMGIGKTPYECVLDIIKKTLDLSKLNGDPVLSSTGTQLVIGLLENLHGKIDDMIIHIIELLVNEIGNNQDKSAKKMIIQGLSMCFAYNCALTFKILEEKEWTQGVFETIFELLEDIKYDFEIQRMTLGLLAIVSNKDCELPEIVLKAMPSIFEQILLLCQKSIYTREQKAKSPEEREKAQYDQALNILDDWSDEEEYDEDEDYTPEESKEEEEELYVSFTRDVDEVQQTQKVIENLDNQVYEMYFGKVSRDDLNALQTCFKSQFVAN